LRLSEKSEKPKRKLLRPVSLHFRATEEEATEIRARMAEMGITDFGAFSRKMMLEGYHITLDLKDVREMTAMLGRVGNNVNQIARRVNMEGSIYAADMDDIKSHMDEIWSAAREILSQLAKIK
jgi:hypothetical protein